MADVSKFKTAHQLARELLAGPDHVVVLPTPTFDMPGCFTAFPVKSEAIEIEGIDVVAILADAGQPSTPPADAAAQPHG